eukprot:scaffold3685_cov242-Pinguiococcus_pyrenoidosus.AAC.1
MIYAGKAGGHRKVSRRQSRSIGGRRGVLRQADEWFEMTKGKLSGSELNTRKHSHAIQGSEARPDSKRVWEEVVDEAHYSI